jgi:transcriptional regulator with XRE-family HTH domain
MTLKDLAGQLHLSAPYWSRIERALENPPKDELIALAACILQENADPAFVAAGRLPPDMRAHLGEIVRQYRARLRT